MCGWKSFSKEEDKMSKMLIVDDEQGVLDELTEVFSEYGYEISTATNGKDAIAFALEGRPDIMLLDIRMPEMDGIETLKRVKEAMPDLGVIMVTAVQEEKLAKQTMALGAFDYITKPVDLNYLRTSVVIKMINMFSEDEVTR